MTHFVERPKTLGAAIRPPFSRSAFALIESSNACLHPLSHLRQPSLPKSVDKVVSYRCIAQRLGVEPMGDGEMRVGDQEQFCFSPRLLLVAYLRKRGSQEFA